MLIGVPMEIGSLRVQEIGLPFMVGVVSFQKKYNTTEFLHSQADIVNVVWSAIGTTGR